MTPATQLYFNDAAWLDAPEGMTLAHPILTQATCEALCVTSLRNNHQTRGSQSVSTIACPPVGRLREELAQVRGMDAAMMWGAGSVCLGG